ncbi:LexA family protein [Paenibacillus sp. FSL M7-1046]|uniref:LexA family protein n=1 Tax=Paenibacillus sp. FSL M7-1046 TaxID=2975315 RepID=UPI0030F62378
MKKPLTNRQAETLQLIKGFIDQKGYAPSVTEVADLLKLKSRSTAHSLVKQLVNKGYLEKTDFEVRTLRVVGQEDSNALSHMKPYVKKTCGYYRRMWSCGKSLRALKNDNM